MNTYGFYGLGLIGGSLAKSLRKIDPSCRIIACSRSMETCRSALNQGLIDDVCHGPDDPAYMSCGMIFLCAHFCSDSWKLEPIGKYSRY